MASRYLPVAKDRNARLKSYIQIKVFADSNVGFLTSGEKPDDYFSKCEYPHWAHNGCSQLRSGRTMAAVGSRSTGNFAASTLPKRLFFTEIAIRSCYVQAEVDPVKQGVATKLRHRAC